MYNEYRHVHLGWYSARQQRENGLFWAVRLATLCTFEAAIVHLHRYQHTFKPIPLY